MSRMKRIWWSLIFVGDKEEVRRSNFSKFLVNIVKESEEGTKRDAQESI